MIFPFKSLKLYLGHYVVDFLGIKDLLCLQFKVEENSSEDENVCCDELEYSVKRLVKGLASSRKGARQGFATVLTEVLYKFDSLSPETVLKLIAENLEVTGSSKSTVIMN